MLYLHCNENGRKWKKEISGGLEAAIRYAESFGPNVHVNVMKKPFSACKVSKIEYIRQARNAFYLSNPKHTPFWSYGDAIRYANAHYCCDKTVYQNGHQVCPTYTVHIGSKVLPRNFDTESAAVGYAYGWLERGELQQSKAEIRYCGEIIRTVSLKPPTVGRMDSISKFLHEHEGFIEFQEEGKFTCSFLLESKSYIRSFPAEVTMVPQLRDFINEVLANENAC